MPASFESVLTVLHIPAWNIRLFVYRNEEEDYRILQGKRYEEGDILCGIRRMSRYRV